MAAIAKTFRRSRAGSPTRPKTKTSPDYWALVILLAVMTAIILLTMWLASLGGGNSPVDPWALMP